MRAVECKQNSSMIEKKNVVYRNSLKINYSFREVFFFLKYHYGVIKVSQLKKKKMIVNFIEHRMGFRANNNIDMKYV